MSRKSAKVKLEEYMRRKAQERIDREHEERSLKFDTRRDDYHAGVDVNQIAYEMMR